MSNHKSRNDLAFDWPALYRFADVRNSRKIPQLALEFSLRRDYPLMSASRKAYGINSFFQSYRKLKTQKSYDRVFPQAECKNSFSQSYFEILYHQSSIQINLNKNAYNEEFPKHLPAQHKQTTRGSWRFQ